MPATYNGVGTHYYGRRNLSTRPGVCPHCGRNVLLESYDTRLYFVILFIPIVPLGRKRIIDKCPSCRRHYVANADKWETAKQLEISGAQNAFRANPTPESAIAVHRQMLQFHETDEAEKFARTMTQQFPDSANVQAYLAAALLHLGRARDAAPFFNRALELRPDLPAARVGVAEEKIRDWKLDEARQLLDFLQQPGAAQLYSLQPLERLAFAYQKADKHEDALALFANLQEALPAIAQVKTFRQAVQKSEKALGRAGTMLPKKKFSWRGLWSRGSGRGFNARSAMMLGIGLAVVALGFLIANEYIRRHRTVYVVNAYRQPAAVEIDGHPAIPNVRGVQSVVVSEGRHHARVTGPVQQELDFEVRTDYFSRWGDDPAWVINVGGAAILEVVTARYSANPSPSSVALRFGRPFESLSTVTNPFQDLPKSISVNRGEEKTLVKLALYNGPGENLVSYLADQKDLAQALAVTETWLKTHPDDETMLRALIGLGQAEHAEARVESYLQSGLQVRPVRIAWHRVYQTLHDKAAGHDALVAQYERWLAAEPENSALTYLLARVESDRTRSRPLLRRAIELDPKNPYPYYALGYDRMAAGDWSEAEKLFAAAAKLRPGEPLFQTRLTQARLANGEAPVVERELRGELSRNPADPSLARGLIDVVAIALHPKDIPAEVIAFERAAAKYGARGKPAVTALRLHAAYVMGDFPGLARIAASDNTPASAQARFEAEIEQGHLEAAEAAWKGATGDPSAALVLSIAHRQAGDATGADALLGQVAQRLANVSVDEAALGALLQRATPPTGDELKNLTVEPSLKAVAAAALIAKFPRTAGELTPLIRRLNVGRDFPYHFVDRFASAAR